MRLRTVLACLALLTLAACGGSSSETPWPAEPDKPAPGPAGESAPPGAPMDLPEAPAEEGAPGEPDAGR